MQNRKVKIGLLAFACCLATVGGVVTATGMTTASATAVERKTIEQVTATMASGASVRIKTTEDPNADDYALTGIRFHYTMSAEDYVALMNNVGADYASVTFGMLITPSANEEKEPFTYENVFGANAVYDWAVYDSEKGVWVYNGDGSKTRLTNVQASEMTLVDGEYVMYGSLVNLKDANISKEFFGLGYMKATSADGESSYKFASFSENGKDSNVRSIAHVAQMAIEDTSSKAPSQKVKENLQKHYVEKVFGMATTYTVEHRRQNADGSYTVLAEETVESTIGAEGTATANEAYGRVIFHEEKGTVYPNGRQTLTVDYAYKPENLMQYRILLPENATKAERFAAEELIYFYQAATGLTLERVETTDANGYVISIGDTALYRASAEEELAAYGDAGYSIRTVDDNIVINSVSEQGKIFGVYGFMEEVFGLKIYAENVFDFTNTAVSEIAALNIAETPSFNAGFLDGVYADNFRATMRMRMTANFEEYGITDDWSVNYSAHTFFQLVDPDVYYDEKIEWFSDVYNDEQGKPYSLCMYQVLNNNELQNVILTNMKAAIEAEPNTKYFVFGYEDEGTYFCTCTDCKTLANENGGANVTLYLGSGYVGTYIQATNWLADAIHAWLETAYPERADEVKIGMLAYSSGAYAPKRIDVNVSDNAFVCFAPDRAEHADEFNTSTDKDTKNLYQTIERWARVAKNIVVCNYSGVFSDYIAPFNDIETAQGYFQAFENLSPFKMYTYGARDTMRSFEGLRTYVFSNLMRDTSKTVDALKGEFFTGYYGDVASDMENYYNTIDAKLQTLQSVTATGNVQNSIYSSDWSYAELTEYLETLNAILAKVSETELYDRVLPETMFVRCALFDFYMDELKSAWGDSTLAEKIAEFTQDAVKCNFTYAYEGGEEALISAKIDSWLVELSN